MEVNGGGVGGEGLKPQSIAPQQPQEGVSTLPELKAPSTSTEAAMFLDTLKKRTVLMH